MNWPSVLTEMDSMSVGAQWLINTRFIHDCCQDEAEKTHFHAVSQTDPFRERLTRQTYRWKFHAATLSHLEELSSILLSNEVCFLSQDDKARVPIGLTAENKQAPLLMHMEYRVTLPNHDYVVTSKHKVIPSVYAGIQILKKNGRGKPETVSYSGPTYIAIRSGPDEKSHWCCHPFVKNNLKDTFFIGTNAPWRSAYNRVERLHWAENSLVSYCHKNIMAVILVHKAKQSTKDQTLGLKLKSGHNLLLTHIQQLQNTSTLNNLNWMQYEWQWKIRNGSTITFAPVNILLGLWNVATWNVVVKCEAHISTFYLAEFFLLQFQSTKQLLKASERADPKSHKFPSLFVAQSLNFNDILPRSTRALKLRPYDLYCSSLQFAGSNLQSLFTILCLTHNNTKLKLWIVSRQALVQR